MRLALLFILAISTPASPHPLHYFKTHKMVILADLFDVGAWAAESYTSVQCLRDMRLAGVVTSGCTKQGWEALKFEAPLQVFGNHMAWRYAPDHDARYVFTYWTGPSVLMGIHMGLVNDTNSDVGFLRNKYGSGK